MIISLYFINFNDSEYIPFIAHHYSRFCQKIVMYDNYSTDDSVKIALQYGMEVRTFGKEGELNDQSYLDVKNHCWKEEKGKSDYVIVCDADEFVVPVNLKGNFPTVSGFNMISDGMPKESIFEINTGSPSKSYSKQAIFSPSHVKEINFFHGCHTNQVVSEDLVALDRRGSANLFHYRLIGGYKRLSDRHNIYRERMCEFNKRHGLGVHYLLEDESRRNEWDLIKKNAFKLF